MIMNQNLVFDPNDCTVVWEGGARYITTKISESGEIEWRYITSAELFAYRQYQQGQRIERLLQQIVNNTDSPRLRGACGPG